jgi:hypothetical protein
MRQQVSGHGAERSLPVAGRTVRGKHDEVDVLPIRELEQRLTWIGTADHGRPHRTNLRSQIILELAEIRARARLESPSELAPHLHFLLVGDAKDTRRDQVRNHVCEKNLRVV